MISRNLTILALTLAAASASHGAVVISEVLYNEVGSDTTGEFVELYNNGSAAVDIGGWKIGDIETKGKTGENSGNGGMGILPTGTSIPAGGTIVIASSATRFQTVYGFAPNFEANSTDAAVADLASYTDWVSGVGGFSLANGGDQVLLLDTSDNFVDLVNWGTGTVPSVTGYPNLAAGAADGQSVYRIDPRLDTDTAADFAATDAAPAGAFWTTKSTPGSVVLPSTDTPEPAALAVLGLAAFVGLRRR